MMKVKKSTIQHSKSIDLKELFEEENINKEYVENIIRDSDNNVNNLFDYFKVTKEKVSTIEKVFKDIEYDYLENQYFIKQVLEEFNNQKANIYNNKCESYEEGSLIDTYSINYMQVKYPKDYCLTKFNNKMIFQLLEHIYDIFVKTLMTSSDDKTNQQIEIIVIWIYACLMSIKIPLVDKNSCTLYEFNKVIKEHLKKRIHHNTLLIPYIILTCELKVIIIN